MPPVLPGLPFAHPRFKMGANIAYAHTKVTTMANMLYRRFGRTELQMPVFSCGGMRYQHTWNDKGEPEIPEDNQAKVEATIRHAIELGINHFETARGYGSSERQLGRILPGLPREEIIVQTKIVPTEDPAKFTKMWENSFRLLGLDHVDLLGLHGINTAEILDWCTRPRGCLEAARKWREEGRVRHIGFSTHAPTDVIIRAIETGEFDYVNLHWYYIFQKNWAAVEAARRQDMGVFIISPSDKGGQLYDPPAKLVELCEPLSPMVMNDLFCLTRPEVHTLSIGAARPTDFDEHVKTIELLDHADEILPPILERLERAMVDAVGKDWLATYEDGLPRPDETPGGLNIPVMLWLRNLVKAYDMVDYGKARYNLLGNGDHWFPGKKAEGLDELDFTESLAASPHRDRIPALLAETHELLGGAEVKRLSEE